MCRKHKKKNISPKIDFSRRNSFFLRLTTRKNKLKKNKSATGVLNLMKMYHISYRKSRAIIATVICAGSTPSYKPGSVLDVLLAEPGLSINIKRVLFIIIS